jgi:glycolate oxidase FAD binding subunit
MVAVNASGPRRLQAGACRDSMIGVRFVDGTGAIVKNGGRVMKNVTGLDLVKLMAGSHGTLGVLTEVAFKVLPAPETTVTLAFDGLDVTRAVEAMTAATGTPYEITAAAHVPEGLGDGPVTLLRLEGFEGSVAHRATALARALDRFGPARRIEGAGDWPRLRDAALLAGREGAIWRISVKPTDGVRVAGALPEAALILDWAGGLVWALLPEAVDLRARLKGIPGHATLLRATNAARARYGTFHPEPAPVAAIAQGLRRKFDPRGILNPGIMAP